MTNLFIRPFAIVVLCLFSVSFRAQRSPFTVRDSIQMAHFNEPSESAYITPVWNISPDGSTLILVTTRGLVASNLVESTLWTLDLRATEAYLEKRSDATRPVPKEILKVRGRLEAFQNNSYGSLITECSWSSDSKTIYMLIEREGGRRELDRINMITGRKDRISPNGLSLTKYQTDNRGVSYFASEFQTSTEGHPGDASDVVDTVRGVSISKLLGFSTIFPQNFLFRSDRTGVHRLAKAATGTQNDTAFISPDRRQILTLVPVEKTPIAWKQYKPGTPDEPLYHSESSRFEVLQWEVVDLQTRSRRPLLGSPSGATSDYQDHTQVVWSSGGDHALVTNTFLPLDHQIQQGQESRIRPCAAAYVGIENGSASCIVLERSSREHESSNSWFISHIKFGQTEHNVIIDLSWRGRHKTECYSSMDGVWSEDPKSTCDASIAELNRANQAPVRLELTQSLDEPPSLWAGSPKNSRRVQIWNPNPWIAAKKSGTTSVYHWLDADKREWTGGLMLPEGYKPGVRYPLVIQTHGFSPSQFLVDGSWNTGMAARPLAAAGFVVLQAPDNREQTVTLEELRIHVNGYLAAIDHLAESGIIDPKRVGIIGFSRTCWYVEESLIEFPDRFAAAVLADGFDASYVAYMLGAPEMLGGEAEHYNGGQPIGKALETWIKSAPGFRLSGLKIPLFVQAIGPDSLLGEWEIYASLRVQKKPVDMLYLPRGQHVLQNPAERMASEQGDVDWFCYWLGGKEDRDPSKKARYDRWDELRGARGR